MTKEKIIGQKLSEMNPGDYFNMKDFVNQYWINGFDIWSRRSFAVLLQKAKNKITEKEFRIIKGNVTRIK